VAVTPASATVVVGATQVFVATVGGASDVSVTWSTTCGSLATAAATATLTASGSPRTCTVTATSVADPTRSGQATVTLTAPTVGANWPVQIGTTEDDDVVAVAVAPDGTVFAVGETYGDFVAGAYSGDYDLFVVAFEADGTERWRLQFGTSGDDRPLAVVVHTSGDAVVVGQTDGALFATDLPASDAFALRLDAADGGTVWATQFGTDGVDRAAAAVVAANGDVYVGGAVGGDLGSGTLSGLRDAFVARLDGATGAVSASVQFGSTSTDDVFAIALLPGGDLVVGGRTGFVMPGSGLGAPIGADDAFVRRLTAGLSAVWTQQFGAAGGAVSVRGLAVAADGDLRMVGNTDRSLAGQTHLGGRDVFVSRLEPTDGSRTWTVQDGSDGVESAQGLVVDADGTAWVIGSTDGAFVEAFAGSERAILLGVDADGVTLLRDQFGVGDNTYGNGVAIARPGVLVLGGSTNGVLGGSFLGGLSDGFVLERAY
jgi:hypothetical protein